VKTKPFISLEICKVRSSIELSLNRNSELNCKLIVTYLLRARDCNPSTEGSSSSLFHQGLEYAYARPPPLYLNKQEILYKDQGRSATSLYTDDQEFSSLIPLNLMHVSSFKVN